MVRRRRARGLSVLECTIALAVVASIATTVAVTGTSHLRAFARAHEETLAGRAAASRLERLSADRGAFVEGTTSFAPNQRQGDAVFGKGSQTLTRVGPGLWRADVEVTWPAADGGTGRVKLATLFAREEPR